MLQPLLFLALLSSAGESRVLETYPLDGWRLDRSDPILYPGLERWRAKGLLPGIGLDTRPLTWRELNLWLSAIDADDPRLDDYDRFLLQVLQKEIGMEGKPVYRFDAPQGEAAFVDVFPFAEGLLETEEDTTRTNLTFETSLALRTRFGGNIGSYTRIAFHAGHTDLGPGESDPITWVLPGFELPVREAYVMAQIGSFTLELGRDKAMWGPGIQSLILNRTEEPLDLVRISTPFGPMKLTVILSLLDEDQDKYLAAQRLEIRPFPWLNVGISESVVFSERVSLSYLNPVIPYYMIQRYYGEDRDNILGAFDFSVFPYPGLEVYGQLLMDDARVGAEYDSFPDKWALLAGFSWANPMGLENTQLRAEYARVSKYTYTHKSHVNDYTFRDTFLLTHDLGNDAEGLYVELRRFFRLPVIVTLSAEVTRRGEGRVKIPWEDTWEYFRDPFPSGVVEEKRAIALELDWNPLGAWELILEGGFTTFENFGHVRGDDREVFSAALSARYRI
jgi:hypothetical protein